MIHKLKERRSLLSGAGDAVCYAGSADEAVWVNDDTALLPFLLPGVVDNEAAPVIIIVGIHLHHVTRTDVQIQPAWSRETKKILKLQMD